MTSPWVDGENLNAAKMYARTTALINAAQYQAGVATVTPSAANTPTSVTVTFPTPFPSTPASVQLTANTALPGTAVLGVGYTALTATGFTLTLTRTNTTATSVAWIAFP